MNKNLFVKALSFAGALIIVINISNYLSSPTLAMFPQDFSSPFFNNNPALNPNNSLIPAAFWGEPMLPNNNPSIASPIDNYSNVPPYYNLNQPDNSQSNLFAEAEPYFLSPEINMSDTLRPVQPFTPSTENYSNYNCQSLNLPAEDSLNNIAPSPPSFTLPQLNLPFAPGEYNLTDGEQFGRYLKKLFKKKLIMGKFAAFSYAQQGLHLAQNNERFFQEIQRYGITPEEIRNIKLLNINPYTPASEIYTFFAQNNYRVWSAIFNALVYLGYV